MTRPTEAFIEQVRNDEDGLLTVLSAVSLLLPVVVLADVLLDLAERLSAWSAAPGGQGDNLGDSMANAPLGSRYSVVVGPVTLQHPKPH